MKTVNLNNTKHLFEKKNLITIVNSKTNYDIMKCIKCGISGKRYGISDTIHLDGRTSQNKIGNCDGKDNTPIKIEIINCTAMGRQFGNLTPGSVHEIVEPPKGYENGKRGYWVMGIGEPVLVLFGEFKVKD